MRASEYFKDENPVYVKMFSEMCRRVGTTLEDSELIQEPDNKWGWDYRAYTWSEAEEAEYVVWLIDYIYRRRRVLGLGYASKQYIRSRVVPMFMLQYSWKYSEKV